MKDEVMRVEGTVVSMGHRLASEMKLGPLGVEYGVLELAGTLADRQLVFPTASTTE
jgi:hypothetical protein